MNRYMVPALLGTVVALLLAVVLLLLRPSPAPVAVAPVPVPEEEPLVGHRTMSTGDYMLSMSRRFQNTVLPCGHKWQRFAMGGGSGFSGAPGGEIHCCTEGHQFRDDGGYFVPIASDPYKLNW